MPDTVKCSWHRNVWDTVVCWIQWSAGHSKVIILTTLSPPNLSKFYYYPLKLATFNPLTLFMQKLVNATKNAKSNFCCTVHDESFEIPHQNWIINFKKFLKLEHGHFSNSFIKITLKNSSCTCGLWDWFSHGEYKEKTHENWTRNRFTEILV